MWNLIQKFRQSSIVFEKAVILSGNWKLWRASTTMYFYNFCRNFAHVPYLSISTKVSVGFFLFCLELDLFAKIKKYLVSTHSQEPVLLINQDLNKTSHKTFCRHLSDGNVRKISAKILNCTVVGARQSFQFFWQITWFLRNTKALSKFKYWILHHLISIIKLQNN